MDLEFYGDEDQNELMAMIKEHREDDDMDFETRVAQLDEEISIYKEAINDARDALASAEQELDAVLAANAELPY